MMKAVLRIKLRALDVGQALYQLHYSVRPGMVNDNIGSLEDP